MSAFSVASLLHGDSNGLAAKKGGLEQRAPEPPAPAKEVNHRTVPFSEAVLAAHHGFDPADHVFLELSESNRLYDILRRYLAHPDSGARVASLDVSLDRKTTSILDSLNLKGKEPKRADKRTTTTTGLGLHELRVAGRSLRVLSQALGEPVGTGCGVDVFRNMVVFAPARADEGGYAAARKCLEDLCEMLLEWDESHSEKVYKVYAWDCRRNYWRLMATKPVRPLDSVILPAELRARVVGDLDDFCTEETAQWYVHHGISYKRSYLFYGPPGTGKSSLIRALAGHLGRNVCFLQPAHPQMTDDSLQDSVQQAPANSIIVLEDVDALFGADRKSGNDNCPLTFSGLLNALDGVANSDGIIFVLTTNHIERLDPALIRAGRVDVRVEFPPSTVAQARGLFLHFYPGREAQAEAFAAKVAARFQRKEDDAEGQSGKQGERVRLTISMAALQQHFIQHRKQSPDETLAAFDAFEGYE